MALVSANRRIPNKPLLPPSASLRSYWIVNLAAGVMLGLTISLQAIAAQSYPAPQLIARTDPTVSAMRNLKSSTQRWIEVDVSRQRLIAWEGQVPVYAIVVSTGKADSPTPTGVFSIQTRHRYARMQGEDYDVPDVPYTLYYSGNYAIHGAYWHHRFGTPVSHGCINVAVDHARWLFGWAKLGTPVVVHD